MTSVRTSGHKLGSKVVANEAQWRCNVCTFLNGMSVSCCRRCREPTSEEDRARMMVKISSKVEKSNTVNENKSSSLNSSSKSGGSKSQVKGKKKNGSQIHTVKHQKTKTTRRRPKEQFHKGDLGYKPKRNNIHTTVQSKLNHDTVSYRAKFEKDTPNAKSKSKVHTLSSMKKNGFVSSSAAPKKHVNPHDEKPAPRPAKYSSGNSLKMSGKRQGGLLGKLQSMASSKAMPSMRTH